jgi:catechol 2,3-dioxygenase-like lactoylglutathione lyase family enzyme
MAIIGLHHPGISVPDLDAAVAFYTNVIGLRVVYRESWENSPTADAVVGMEGSAAKAAILWAGNAAFELFEYIAPPPTPMDPDRPVADHGINHICFQVTDTRAEYERLTDAGMRFHTAPVQLGEGWVTYGRDPWGNVIEIQDVNDPKYPSVDGGWEFTTIDDRTY